MAPKRNNPISVRESEVLRIVGENVRLARFRAGFARDEAARAAEMQPTQLARIERGEVRYRVTALVQIADALGVDPADFLRGVRR